MPSPGPSPGPRKGSRAGDLARVLAPLAVLGALAAAWKLTPLGDHSDELVRWLAAARSWPLAPGLLVAAFVVGGLAMVPLTVLVLAAVLAFGPVLGACYAMAGALASAAAAYLIGRRLGRAAVERLLGERARRVNSGLIRQGIIAVALLRNIPVAPYSMINLIAGAAGIRLRDFLIGTFIGLLPGIVAFAIFGDSLARFLARPRAGPVIVAVAVILGMSLVSVAVGRRLMTAGRRDDG